MALFWNGIFLVFLVGVAYLANKVIPWEKMNAPTVWGKPIPLVMIDFFLVVVFLMWLLQLFGIGL